MKNLGKILVVFLAVMFLGGLVTTVMAAPNTTNVNNKGSLLIFPKIEVDYGDDKGDDKGFKDTIITIGNDLSTPIDLKCYYVGFEERWDFVDFTLKLTANQPVWWSAKTGKGMVSGVNPVTVQPFPFREGELKCFAIKLADESGTDQQIKFNHLYGSAIILDNYAQSWQYSAYAFVGDPMNTLATGDPLGVPGEIPLNGATYSACPSYMIHNFFAADVKKPAYGAGIYDNDLAIALCTEDLRRGAGPISTDVLFEIWNENEQKRTGAEVNVTCWFEDFLYNNTKEQILHSELFSRKGLSTDLGRFRARTLDSSVPILTVLSTKIAFKKKLKEDDSKGKYRYDRFGTVGSHAGINPNGVIYWDPQDIVPQAPKPTSSRGISNIRR